MLRLSLANSPVNENVNDRDRPSNQSPFLFFSTFTLLRSPPTSSHNADSFSSQMAPLDFVTHEPAVFTLGSTPEGKGPRFAVQEIQTQAPTRPSHRNRIQWPLISRATPLIDRTAEPQNPQASRSVRTFFQNIRFPSRTSLPDLPSDTKVIFSGSDAVPRVTLTRCSSNKRKGDNEIGDELSARISMWSEATDDEEWDDGRSAVEEYVQDYHSATPTLRVPIIAHLGSNEVAREALDGMDQYRSDARDTAIRWKGKIGVYPSRPTTPVEAPVEELFQMSPTLLTKETKDDGESGHAFERSLAERTGIEVVPAFTSPPTSPITSRSAKRTCSFESVRNHVSSGAIRHKASMETIPKRGRKWFMKRMKKAVRRLWPL